MEKNSRDIDTIILSFLERSISSEDLQNLRKWVKESVENKEYFRQMENTWLLSNIPADKHSYHKEEAYRCFGDKTAKTKEAGKKMISFKRIFYYAACVLLIFGAGIGAKFGIDALNPQELLSYSLEAPRRAKLKVDLPDGSVIWLNAASKLSYNNQFGVFNRDLSLQGEGYFEISKNPELPLIVTSGNTTVKVLGTKFNVRNYEEDDEIRVGLLEGAISFSDSRYDKPVLLKPREVIICNKKSGVLTLKSMETAYMNAWIKDDVFFNEEKLGNIARVLERAFDVKVRFENDDLKNLIFYGNITIGADNVVQIMDVMSATNKFRYHYDMDKKEIEIFH